jgi:uncharacterized membrane protein
VAIAGSHDVCPSGATSAGRDSCGASHCQPTCTPSNDMTSTPDRLAPGRRSFWAGVLLGIGLAGTVDEVVLHQILHWHHLYDRSTPAVGLVSDGLFHLGSTAAVIAGMILLARDHILSTAGSVRFVLGAVLVGTGGFNLYDGIIQHKVLRLHQVRPGVRNELPYDVVFIGAAALLVVGGLVLLRQARERRLK